jgi:hypothetical protein
VLGTQELLLALFISGVFVLVMGASTLVYDIGEIKHIMGERRRLDQLKGSDEVEYEGEEDRLATDLVILARSMRVCRAELVVAISLLVVTLLAAALSIEVDLGVYAGIVIAIAMVLVLWAYARLEHGKLLGNWQ